MFLYDILIFFILSIISLNIYDCAKSRSSNCNCGLSGSNSFNSKIYGGTEASSDQYPWVAHLRFFEGKDSTRYGLCGGFLVDESHVVTAAHCIMDQQDRVRSPKQVEVYVGVNNLKNLPKPYKVKQFFYPNDYNGDELYNDIAIMRLEGRVNGTKSKKFMPVCLPKSDDEPYSDLTVAGFGRLGPNRTPSERLMHVKVQYIHKPQCDTMIKEYILRTNPDVRRSPDRYDIPKTHSAHMCAVNKVTGGDACRGDSGGPIMYKTSSRSYAVGIVSGAFDECGDNQTPGLYTRVKRFRSFISSIAKKAVFCDY